VLRRVCAGRDAGEVGGARGGDGLRGKEISGKPIRVRILKPGDEFHDRSTC